MQIPVPIWKRRSISAAERTGRSSTSFSLVCGLLAALSFCAAVADIPPAPANPFKVLHHWRGEVSTIVTLEGGNIGHVDLNEIENDDLSSVVDLLRIHSEWTGAQPDLELVLRSLSAGRVMFNQHLRGVIVSYEGLIEFDSHGSVTRLRTGIVKPSAVRSWPTVPESDSVVAAMAELRSFLGGSDAELQIPENPSALGLTPEVVQPSLIMVVREPDRQPDFFWRMIMVATGEAGWYIIRVNAQSEDVRIIPINRN